MTRVLLLARHPSAVMLAGLVIMLVLIGMATPSPRSWTGDSVWDVTVKQDAEWHPLQDKWTLGAPAVSAKESKWLNVWSILQNALFLVSGSYEIQFILEDATTHAPLQVRTDDTGDGGVFGTTKSVSVTFREVPPGMYVLRVQILDENGAVHAERTTQLHVTPEGA